jgi:hypothetical protein
MRVRGARKNCKSKLQSFKFASYASDLARRKRGLGKSHADGADRMFHELYLLSWNPLFNGVVGGGVFALLGAWIGGRLALRAQREQRTEEIKGAIRAVAMEVMGNATKLSAVLEGLRDPKWPHVVWIPNKLFANEAYDSYLSSASLRLSIDDLIVLFQAYVGLFGVNARLEETVRQFSEQRPPDSVVRQLLILFAPSAKYSEEAIRMLAELEVWTDNERNSILDGLKTFASSQTA